MLVPSGSNYLRAHFCGLSVRSPRRLAHFFPCAHQGSSAASLHRRQSCWCSVQGSSVAVVFAPPAREPTGLVSLSAQTRRQAPNAHLARPPSHAWLLPDAHTLPRRVSQENHIQALPVCTAGRHHVKEEGLAGDHTVATDRPCPRSTLQLISSVTRPDDVLRMIWQRAWRVLAAEVMQRAVRRWRIRCLLFSALAFRPCTSHLCALCTSVNIAGRCMRMLWCMLSPASGVRSHDSGRHRRRQLL